jgi:hypothetical protein
MIIISIFHSIRYLFLSLCFIIFFSLIVYSYARNLMCVLCYTFVETIRR